MNTAAQSYWIFSLGFLAQSLFGARLLVQWWMAEKSKEAVSPTLFWKFSLAGSALFLVYGVLRADIVIIAGQAVSYFIYIRNLQLKGEWQQFSTSSKLLLGSIPVACILWTAAIPENAGFAPKWFLDFSPYFLAGMVGQGLLNIRFLYQLYYSEQQRKSSLPAGFWWLSLCGAILLVTYAVYRRDPVLLLAQGMAIVPYARNIYLGIRSVHRNIPVSETGP